MKYTKYLLRRLILIVVLFGTSGPLLGNFSPIWHTASAPLAFKGGQECFVYKVGVKYAGSSEYKSGYTYKIGRDTYTSDITVFGPIAEMRVDVIWGFQDCTSVNWGKPVEIRYRRVGEDNWRTVFTGYTFCANMGFRVQWDPKWQGNKMPSSAVVDDIMLTRTTNATDCPPAPTPTPTPTPNPPSTACQNGKSEEVSTSKVLKFNFAKLGVMPSRLTKLNKAVQKLLGEGTVKAVQGAGFIAKQTSPIVVEPVVEILQKGEVKIGHKRDCCNGKWSKAYYNASGKATLFTLGAKAKFKLPIPQYPALAIVGSREVSAEASFQGKPVSKCNADNSTSRSSIKGEVIVGLKFENKFGLGDSAGIVSGQGVVKATVGYPVPVSVTVDSTNIVQGLTVNTARSSIALYAEIGIESCFLDGGYCYYSKSIPLMDTKYDLLW